jgi:hypothetical protein
MLRHRKISNGRVIHQQAGKMELRTAVTETAGRKIVSRMVFKNITTNALDWDWQRSLDGGKSWQDVWNIHYQRIE